MQQPRRSIVAALIFAIAGMFLLVSAVAVYAAGNPNQGCNQDPYPNSTGNGANHSGPYDDTCDGSASQNGNGGGEAKGKPCAGCVGKADEKNPQGQYPNGSDRNAGYECDRNHGIGRSNPAHTSCTSSTTPSPSPSVSASESASPSPSPSVSPSVEGSTTTNPSPSPSVEGATTTNTDVNGSTVLGATTTNGAPGALAATGFTLPVLLLWAGLACLSCGGILWKVAHSK